MNKMNRNERQEIHLQNREPIVTTGDFIGGCVPSIHTNHRTKLGEVL